MKARGAGRAGFRSGAVGVSDPLGLLGSEGGDGKTELGMHESLLSLVFTEHRVD
jgi:hypothetical protein